MKVKSSEMKGAEHKNWYFSNPKKTHPEEKIIFVYNTTFIEYTCSSQKLKYSLV